MKEVTICNIASALNISIGTVSHALKNDPVVNKGTKKEIFYLANLINQLKGIGNMQNANTIIIRSNLIIRKSSLKKEAIQINKK